MTERNEAIKSIYNRFFDGKINEKQLDFWMEIIDELHPAAIPDELTPEQELENNWENPLPRFYVHVIFKNLNEHTITFQSFDEAVELITQLIYNNPVYSVTAKNFLPDNSDNAKIHPTYFKIQV